jgi:hypothetical protein
MVVLPGLGGTTRRERGFTGMMTARQRISPMPGSDEARQQGCTCPEPTGTDTRQGEAVPIDENCPLHGRAAIAHDRAGERGPIDTEGDIVDAASEPELRRD